MSTLRHEPGDIIKDKYTVRELLGGGAFGTVYRVEETLGAHTLVLACKEMHVLDDPETGVSERGEALRMFQEESFLLGTIRHPHIPAAHFEVEKGTWLACSVCGKNHRGVRQCPEHGTELQVIRERFYLLMDFIEGDDLEVRLRKNGGRPLPETNVLDWALQVCDALAAVHAKGFSHRDIKPANIKIRRDANQAMLIDFGLVKPSTVAGGYGTMPMRASSRMGTPGYAPVLAEEQAQPDARTDILALGMTLYSLLTGLDPTDAAQLETMRGRTPKHVNFGVSKLVEDVILRAIKINPAERYPDIAAMRSGLSAARYPVEIVCATCGFVQRAAAVADEKTRCDRCERPVLATSVPAPSAATHSPGTPAPPKPPRPVAKAPQTNPFWPRIEALRSDITSGLAPLVSRFDARITEIEEIRAKGARATVGMDGQCPCCRIVKLLHVAEKPNGDCPICRQTKLQLRKWELKHCAICGDGTLHKGPDDDAAMCCPVCRKFTLHTDERRKFGLVNDIWWLCDSCGCEWDVLLGGSRATLVSVKNDPQGRGAKWQGQTFALDEWHRLSGRIGESWQCDKCEAQVDTTGDKVTLVEAPSDPRGVAAKLLGQAISKPAWARLARDLAVNAGTHACGFCRAEFDYETAGQTLTLVQPGNDPPDWARQWLGVPVSLKTWYFKSAGKRSPQPGLVCPQCHTEFDITANALKLVHTQQPVLLPFVGKVLPAPDWYRRAAGAPTEPEIIELNRELTQLQSQRALERNQLLQNEHRRRDGLQQELRGLLKHSVVGGFIEIKRLAATMTSQDWASQPGRFVVLPLDVSAHHAVLPTETLRWELPAQKCTLVTLAGGIPSWNREGQGRLTITTERIFFSATGQKNFQVALHDITQIEVYPSSVGTNILELVSPSFKQRTSFEILEMPWSLVLDGEVMEMTMTPKDVAAILRDVLDHR